MSVTQNAMCNCEIMLILTYLLNLAIADLIWYSIGE